MFLDLTLTHLHAKKGVSGKIFAGGDWLPETAMIMIAVKGYAAHSATSPLRPFDFERRDLRPKDVLIDILYRGICHSDLDVVRNEWGRSIYPIVARARDRRQSR